MLAGTFGPPVVTIAPLSAPPARAMFLQTLYEEARS